MGSIESRRRQRDITYLADLCQEERDEGDDDGGGEGAQGGGRVAQVRPGGDIVPWPFGTASSATLDGRHFLRPSESDDNLFHCLFHCPISEYLRILTLQRRQYKSSSQLS